MWECQNCGEKHEDSFAACWNCGASRTGEVATDFRVESEISPGQSGGPCPNCGKGGGYNAWSKSLMGFQCGECGYDTTFTDPARAVAAPGDLTCPDCRATMERGAANLVSREGGASLVFDDGKAERALMSGSNKRRAYSCSKCGVSIVC